MSLGMTATGQDRVCLAGPLRWLSAPRVQVYDSAKFVKKSGFFDSFPARREKKRQQTHRVHLLSSLLAEGVYVHRYNVA